MNHFRVYWLTCVLMILAGVASATTIIMPTDEQLITKSPVIVEGTVVRSNAISRGNAIWTETILAVDRALKGNVSGEITIREVGGEVGNRITRVFGAPEYVVGEQVLAFLTPTTRGDYQTTDLFVGKFNQQRTLSGRRLWHRDDVVADVTLLDSTFRPIQAKNVQRDAAGFEQFVQDRVSGRKGNNNYGVENPLVKVSRSATANFTLISEPNIYRWYTFERGGSAPWYSYGTQPGYAGGGTSEAQTGMSAWTGYASALIRYTYAGAGSGTPVGLSRPNGVNEILFDDPLGEIAGTFNRSGVVGQGGFNGVATGGNWTSTFGADATHTQGTFRAWDIIEGNLTIQDGVSPSAGIPSVVLAEIIAHEFGHTLGFGHSSDGTALMYASITNRGPSLRADDQVAARWLYPNGAGAPAPPPPPPPTVSIPAAPSNLVGAPSGSNISLQWIDNANNETGQWIYVAAGAGSFSRAGDAGPNATAAMLTGAAAGTYRVYVTAYNSAGESTPSNTISVSVGAAAPPPPPPPPTPQAPFASFVVSPGSGTAGSTTFSFLDQSTGSITSRSWNFGDGGTSNIANPTHVYANAGTYTVVLTVSGPGGQSQTTRGLSVSAPAPAIPNVTAAFDFNPASPNVRDNVTFVDASSGSPTAWSWSFGDGTTSSSPNPVHAFAAPGAYFVTLTAFNSVSSNSTSRSITVNALAPYRSLVSVSAQTNGVGGSVWRTELTLFNAGNEPASGQLLFIPGAGGSMQSRPFFLSPRQAVTFGNALLDIFGMPSGAGAIAIEANSAASTPNLKVSSRTFTGGVATYGQGVPSVADDDLQRTLFLTGLESDSDYRTNLGIVNRSSIPGSATLTLFDADGNVVGTTSVNVAANNFQQAALVSYFPAVANRQYSALSLRVDASMAGAISVYASVVDNRTQDPIYLQASALRSGGSAIIPVVGRAPGANGTFWRSDVRLFNPNSFAISVGMRFGDATLPVTIMPARTLTLADVLSRFGLPSGSGALEITWSGGTPVIASRTYTTDGNGGTFGQSIDPVRSFGYDSFVPGLRSDNAFRSNVGFVNGGAGNIGINVTLIASSGQAIATAFVQLGPKSQVQYSLGNLFPGVNVAALGSVTLQAHTDSGPALFAYGSMVDNSSGDPVFFAGM
jgi:PKD repeat protein